MASSVLSNWVKKLGEKLMNNGSRRVRRHRSEIAKRQAIKNARPMLETLEDRITPSNWLVTSAAGSAGSAGNVTLPYAVAHAVNGDTVTFAGALTGHTITLSSTLDISQSISITGLGSANLAVSGNNAVLVFNVSGGVTASISGLTIEHGVGDTGAGIRNTGTLTLTNDAISGNGTIDNFATVNGAGLYNSGTLTMTDCTVNGNVSYWYGGGLYNATGGTATMTDCTIAQNAAFTSGGGIANHGALSLTSCTVAYNYGWDNSAGFPEYGGGIANSGGTMTMDNTIVSGNHNSDVYGTYSGAYDMVGGVTGLSSTLAYNDVGTTQTLALSSTSNAHLTGDPSLAGSVAQNGIPRPASPDVGAYQLNPWIVTDPNGAAGSGSGSDITLPYAVANAPSGSVIEFAPALSGDTITLNATLVLNNSVTIDGLGSAHLAVSGNNVVQVFSVSGSVTASISGLTIEHGVGEYGAGIGNAGTLTLTNDAISGNGTIANEVTYQGAGLYNSGTLTMNDCTVNNNVSYWWGGGLYNTGTATLTDCTVAQNAAYTSGGGIDNYGTLSVTSSTVALNFGWDNIAGYPFDGGGGIYNHSTLTMDNTIVSGNSVADVSGGYTGSFDLVGGVTGLSASLAYNGGAPTETLAISGGSNAVGVGDPAQAGTLAQNLVTRPAAPDVGAYQSTPVVSSSWVVTDPNGAAGSGSAGDVTLPYAVANAPAGSTITFAPALAGDTITLNATLTIGVNLTIEGLGSAELAVSGNNAHQVFNISGGVTASISGLTIEHGSFASYSATANGAGIGNAGALTLTNDAISSNGTIGNAVTNDGAGLYNSGTLVMTDCTVSGNTSFYFGGGIYNTGTATLTDTTIAKNAGFTSGGGIYNNGTMSLTSCTVAYNFGWDNIATYPFDGGGGIANHGSLTMDNTIVSGNNVSDVTGGYTGSYDLVGGVTGLSSTLAYNELGSTETLALASTSSAHLTGDPAQVSTVAQNGIPRPATPDVGAYQINPWIVTDPNGAAGSGSANDITLPYAVANAPSGSFIEFASDLSGDTITLDATLVLDNSVIIQGLGSANLAVSGANSVQVFSVSAGVTATISDLTVEAGANSDFGAGIGNFGTLTLTNDAISGNGTITNGSTYYGGGLYNTGTLTMTDCTVNGNTSYYFGGGLYNSGTATLSNDTIAGNAAFTSGGGIANHGTMSITSCTVAYNFGWGNDSTLPSVGGGIANSGTLSMTNTIVSGNNGSDVSGSYTGSYDLVGGVTGLSATLAYNDGAPTQTLALSATSNAHAVGDPAQAGTIAQNGYSRPADPDVGAYQRNPWIVTDPNGAAGSGSANDITLPYAVANAPAGSTILFDSSLTGDTITLSATLTLSRNVTIDGLGSANLAVSGNDAVEVFHVDAGVTATISGLTIEAGFASTGGGVYNAGSLTLSEDAIANNTSGFWGAGVWSSGTLNVNYCTFVGNYSEFLGGAILSDGGTMTVNNSTVFGNGAFYYGSGIVNYYGSMAMTSDTVSGNVSNSASGVLAYGTAGNTLDNCIVAGNTANNNVAPDVFGGGIYGNITVNYTLVGATDSYLVVTSGGNNQLDVAAGLASSLAYNNGAPTETLALLPGSAAIGAGDPSQAGTIAQNTLVRLAAPDIGSFQNIPLPVGPQTITPNTADLPDNSVSITIYGTGFDSNIANDAVYFNLGVTGTVTAATTTSLTVAITNPPNALGALNAEVVVNIGGTLYGMAAPVQVATEINATWEVNDPAGTGGSLSDMTLPYAVAHTLSGDTITFNAALDGDTITTAAVMTMHHDVTIIGPGASLLTIDGNASHSVFSVASSVTGVGGSISGLTIQDGYSAAAPSSGGGGVDNHGTLTLSEDIIINNSVFSAGGGVFNEGTLTMTDCTIAGNSAFAGGGLANDSHGMAYVTDCTFFENTASAGGSIIQEGTSSALFLTNCTVADSTATSTYGGGGLDTYYGTSTMDNCIFSANVATTGPGPDMYSEYATFNPPLSSNVVNYSLVSDSSGASITGSNNVLDVGANLAASLAFNNGAPTETLALLPGSPAYQTGDPAQMGDVAQNGLVRPAAPDMGAYQSPPAPLGPQTITPNTANLPDNTISITIYGTGFDSNPANDQVYFTLGVMGTVTAATSTSLSVTITNPPDALGALTAEAVVDGLGMASFVQVGTEINATWEVTDPAGSGGSLSDMTLPYAVAHTLSGDTITFAAALDGDTITTTATLTMHHNVAIDGPGAANLAVDGGAAHSVFAVTSSVTGGSISGLTIQDGYNGAAPSSGGGGVDNRGTLTLSEDMIINNSVFSAGGGVFNEGTLTMTDCTIAGNSAFAGGGLANDFHGTAHVTDCTFFENTASAGGSIIQEGTSSALFLTNCTIADSTATSTYGGGGLDTFYGTSTMDNCIFSANVATTGPGPDMYSEYPGVASYNVGNYLLVSNSSGASLTGSNNLLNVAADLAATLAYNNGAPTETLALEPGSPAYASGDPAQVGDVSQNGIVRPANPDMGAYQTPPAPIGPQTITASTANLPDNSVSITIYGTGFDSNPLNDQVLFNLGVTGTVTAATSTSLSVTIVNPPNALAVLTAEAIVDGLGMASFVQVGTEINATWEVTDSAGSGGGLSDMTLPFAADHTLDGDTITFAAALDGDTITVTAAMQVNHAVTIIGPGSSELAVSGGGAVRVFDFNAGGTGASMSGLKIEDGSAATSGGYAGGILNTGKLALSSDIITGNTATTGGGIYNSGTLTVSDCTISDNVNNLVFGAHTGTGSGGGIYNSGTLTMSETTVSDNTAQFGGGLANSNYNYGGAAAVTLSDCTFSGNTGADGSGSGINNWEGLSISLTNCTIADNTGTDVYATSAGIFNPTGGTLSLTDCTVAYNTGDGVVDPTSMDNTLVTGNTGANVTGTYTGAYNLIGAAVTGLSNTLAYNNGALTETLALLAGSSAIGVGDPAQAGTTSQNGLLRPAAPDVGAYQTPTTPTVTPSNALLPVTSTTITIHGTNFDTNPANDSVTFDDGVTGVISAATSTSLTVTLTGLTSVVGGTALHATVVVDGNAIAATQVATAQEVLTASAANLPNTATSIVLHGFGFDSNDLNDSVVFDNGVTGTVTAATGTSLTVSINWSILVGNNTPLHATVTVNGVPDYPGAVQVANVTNPAPSISSVIINQNISALYNAAGQYAPGIQRSMVNDIVYTFSEPVNIVAPGVDPNVFTITVAAGWTGTAPTLTWAAVAGSNNTEWAVSFSGAGVNGGSIANGAYNITVNHPNEITAVVDNQQLTVTAGIAPGTGNPNYATQSFYRLFGDINGDEFVNANDNFAFKAALTTYNAAFDFNGDLTVNAADNFQFKDDLTVNFSGFTPTI